MFNLTPRSLKLLDVIGLSLNFLGGLLLAYDLFTESRNAVAEQETNKLKSEEMIHKLSVESYAQTLSRSDLRAELRNEYQTRLNKENEEYQVVEKKLKDRIKLLGGHGDRAVALGIVGLMLIVIGFLLQLIEAVVSP